MGTTTITRPRGEVRALLEAHIEPGRELLAEWPDMSAESLYREYQTWSERGELILESVFESTGGFMNVSPADEFRGTNATKLLAFKLGSEPLTRESRKILADDIREKLRILESLLSRLDLYGPRVEIKEASAVRSGTSIFIVHGHDLVNREKVRLFLSKVTTREVLVLEDQPGRGSDVLGKLLENAAKAAFAVVVLSPDDLGRSSSEENLRPRARQNVILELGLFVGLLGREKVAALYDPSVELPSDYQGVMWTALAGEDWTVKLGIELKAAGIEVDMNALL